MPCTEEGGGAAATFESQPLSLTITGSQIEACRNQQCSSGTFSSDGFTTPAPFAEFQDQRLFVSFFAPMDQLQDGDVYEIHLAAADGTPVIDVREIATYATVYPNGERCAPACLFASLSPSD